VSKGRVRGAIVGQVSSSPTNVDALDPLMSSWNAMAELDPLWAILSDRKKKFGKWNPEEFFRDGEREARRVACMCEADGVNISRGKMLDFGCGVGRMTRAFSQFFSSIVGIDVSGKMVELARKFNADRPNCEFVASAKATMPFADATFDFVFSVLVLQHLPKKSMILGYISEFIRVAKEGGVIIFQLTDEVPFRQRIQGRRRLWSLLTLLGVPQSWLFKMLGLTPIRMNGISREEVERFVGAQRAQVKAVERYDPSEKRYHSYYYLVVKGHGT
jgi:ubiquinone/menaquinone biosynthesis C-methylase UbiE